jgi:hypothetical protein
MKRTIYILILGAAILTSCTKYLDIKPYGEVIPKTADEFASLLHKILESIDYGEEYIIGEGTAMADLECYSDNVEGNLTLYPDGNTRPVYVGAQMSSKPVIYERLYSTIRDCNIVLDNMTERDTRLGKDVLGTAYALRGICYYNLLRNFCEPPVGNMTGLGVPIVTVFDMEAKPVRSSIAKTFELAESDMKNAISYGIEDEIFRFNSDVMEAYLARLYFWVGDWSNAELYAGKVLSKHPLISGQEYLDMMTSVVTPRGNMLLKSRIYSDSSTERIYNTAFVTVATAPISKRFVDLFHEKEKDIRYELSFNAKREVTKMMFACVRPAEMQLIVAESRYHMENEPGALSALNEFRRKRIADVVDYTNETLPTVNPDEFIKVDVYGEPLTPLLNAILNERRKELFMEGDRWFELKRNGRPEMWVAKQGRKYTTLPYMYTFPLPIQDMELVDGLIQNPGYDKTR